MKRKYVVTLDRPSTVSDTAMKEYIRSSVSSMRGCLDPGDPMFHLDKDSIRVAMYPTQEPE